MSDELAKRLARANPVPSGAAVDRADSPRATDLRRQIMASTPEINSSTAGPDPTVRARRRGWALGAAAAAVAAVAATGVVLAMDRPPGIEPAIFTAWELPASNATQMCLPVADIEPMAGASALAGVVTEARDGQVTLDVDRWYTEGAAGSVHLQGTSQSVALDGVDFVVGERYLVTAVDGVVQPCGVSGEATSELELLYERWYG